MKRDEIAKLPKKVLVPFLEVCLRDFYLLDGLWFLGVEKRFGTEQTIDIDHEVFSQLGAIEARRIRESFNLQGEGISLFVEAAKLAPGFVALFDFKVQQISPKEAIMQVTDCYSQKARLKKGIGVFDCRGVDEAEFTSFAKALDSRIKVYCEFSPPDKYFEDLWCQWRPSW